MGEDFYVTNLQGAAILLIAIIDNYLVKCCALPALPPPELAHSSLPVSQDTIDRRTHEDAKHVQTLVHGL